MRQSGNILFHIDIETTMKAPITTMNAMKRKTRITAFASVLRLLCLLLLAASTSASSTSASSSTGSKSDPHLESVNEIWAWVDSAEDGFVTNKQSVSRMEAGNIDTPLMIVANQDILEGELLVQTPWSHMLMSDDPDRDDRVGWYCGTAIKLAEEMTLGRDSFYGPYVQYIHDEPDGQLPTQYSRDAKKLLWDVIGSHPDEVNRSPFFDRKDAYRQRLMPDYLTEGLQNNWYSTCKGRRGDVVMAKAAAMVMQRADDDILIPAYDAYNHRNTDRFHGVGYMNARTVTTHGQYHQTFASRDIPSGEQIFISYNMCEQCGGRREYGFGTAEMYRDYGFVEWFPQRWYVCHSLCLVV